MFLAGAIYLIMIGLVTIVEKNLRRSTVITDRRIAMLELRNINKAFGGKTNLNQFQPINSWKANPCNRRSIRRRKDNPITYASWTGNHRFGEIYYNGESLAIDELEKRNLLGFVFQDFQLFPHLSVLDNLTLSPIKTMSMAKEVAEKKGVVY